MKIYNPLCQTYSPIVVYDEGTIEIKIIIIIIIVVVVVVIITSLP